MAKIMVRITISMLLLVPLGVIFIPILVILDQKLSKKRNSKLSSLEKIQRPKGDKVAKWIYGKLGKLHIYDQSVRDYYDELAEAHSTGDPKAVRKVVKEYRWVHVKTAIAYNWRRALKATLKGLGLKVLYDLLKEVVGFGD